MLRLLHYGLLVLLASLSFRVSATLTTENSSSTITIKNDRLTVKLTKSSGRITGVTLDGQDLLGSGAPGLYFDCQCIPSGFYTPGADSVNLVTGTDRSQVKYAGIVVGQTYKPTGQLFEKYWFVRDGETSIHTWTRLAYNNASTPFLRNLGELRSLFRPNSGIFTHLASNKDRYGPLPSSQATSNQVVVQDATWYLGNTPSDPYVQEVSNWFTKYTFSVPWRGHKAHGMYADGSTTGGKTFGAWLVMNTIDTYFGGPHHSDLVVDGIVYDYIVSGHYGNGSPNITNGFDRTFGPVQYHFNSGGSLQQLLSNAETLATSSPTAFYDDVAQYVKGYVPTSGRGTFKATIGVPSGATKPIAVLSVTGKDFQDNADDAKAYQYWAEIPAGGVIEIPLVKAGVYRLTVYADGIFGEYTQDNIRVDAQKTTQLSVNWTAESAGKELWRIGTPDKSCGEFLHGNTATSKPRKFPEYTIFWGAYDWKTDFPNGVNFTVGKSNVAKDLNYIHWSVFSRPTDPVSASIRDTTNNWTINFEVPPGTGLTGKATFTVQLAGVKTASGNTGAPNGPYSDLELTYKFNDHAMSFIVPYWQSGSCGARSTATCYQIRRKFVFDASYLKVGWNKLILSLPYDATNMETSVMPTSIYVQYDALRLELA